MANDRLPADAEGLLSLHDGRRLALDSFTQASLATLGSTFWRTLGAILSNKIYVNSIWRESPHVGVAGAVARG